MFKLSVFTCVDTDSLIDLTSNRCSIEHRKFINSLHLMDINRRLLIIQNAELVPIALRKYLFPFRTQKSSSVAARILQ